MTERLALLAAALLLVSAGAAGAATITINNVTNNSTCVVSNSDNGNDSEAPYNVGHSACTEPTLGADGNFMRLTNTGTAAATAPPGNSASVQFNIDAGVAADSAVDFGDEYERGKIRYALGIAVTATVVENWTIDLAQNVLGLFGFAGDGTATAVGTQVFGNAGITTIDVDVDATDYSFTPSPAGASSNVSNNGQQSFAFAGSRGDSAIVSGSGNSSMTVTISFDIDAFSNTGCSSFICSSASGGEDAAVLLGYDHVDDSGGGTLEGIRADNYSTWGRAVGPDGYNSTWTINVTSNCGNGAVDPGEGCDQGAANGTSGSCCTAICQPRTAGDVCRPQTGICDVQETCDGANPTCPGDSFEPPTVVCRAASSGELCDIDEYCDGSTAICPGDAIEQNGAVCRGAAGGCDVAETCDGVGKFCPPDQVAVAGTQCRAVAGVCDIAEVCNGVSTSCPSDGFDSVTLCRTSAGVCDVAESCNGSGPNCPADAFASSGVCRASAGECDVAESCNGSGAGCPADTFASSGVCRAAAGACDAAESCNGSGANCPADVLDGSSVCRAATGQCDVAETCDGVGVSCPADGFAADGTSCDDGIAATSGDQCTAGGCAGTSLAGNLDAFKCYTARDLKNPKFAKTLVATLDDQFQNEIGAEFRKPYLHCNPADVQGGIFNPDDHLVCYKVKPAKLAPRPRMEVSNIFGTVQLEANKSTLVCVPSAKTVLP
jgi:hypothetical protein